MKAIIIARVSTEEQKEAGLSLPAQIIRLERYCQSKGFEIIKSCSFDESAYKNQRDEFDRIIDFVLEQKNKVVVCFDKVDRLTRDTFDRRIGMLYEKALGDELELHFVSDGQVINSKISAAQKFQFGITLNLSKYYSDAISDNVKRANEQKLRKGEWTGKAPHGYKNVTLAGDKKDIIVDELLAPVVKQAFELYATGAYSMKLLLVKLKEDHGIQWYDSYIEKLFNNPFYHGIMVVKGNTYPHRYPPLIEKELFDQVQQIKSGFNKKRFKYAGLPYTYRGLLRCGDCGLAITPEKHKGHVYYHCTQYNGKHGAQWLREEEITAQLGQVFKNLQLPTDIQELLEETLNQENQDKISLHAKQSMEFTREHQEATKMMDNLYLDKLRGRISDGEYDRYYQILRDKIDDTTLKLSRLQSAEDNYYITAKYVLTLTRCAYDLFVGSEVEEKRQLTKLVLSNLRLTGRNIVYDAQKPFNLILEATDDIRWRPQWDLNPCFRRERAMSWTRLDDRDEISNEGFGKAIELDE